MPSSQPEFEHLSLVVVAGVARLTLNRPQRLNALAPQTMHEIIAAAHWLAEHDAVRVVLLGGAGRAFCAGFDLDAMRAAAVESGPDPVRGDPDLGRRMIDAWMGIPAITLAVVQGHCLGGGLLLAAACDLRIAGDDAQFGLPEMALGIPLAWGGVPLLVRLLGPTIAMQLVLDAQSHGAATAEQWRFVNRRIGVDRLDAAAVDWAAALAQRPAAALRATKRRFQQVADDLCTRRGSEADADDLRAAYLDPQTIAVQREMLHRRGA
ncbi:MAG: enoyl-CoA hydratase/isomerase family protein [Rubrivivax sp.]